MSSIDLARAPPSPWLRLFDAGSRGEIARGGRSSWARAAATAAILLWKRHQSKWPGMTRWSGICSRFSEHVTKFGGVPTSRRTFRAGCRWGESCPPLPSPGQPRRRRRSTPIRSGVLGAQLEEASAPCSRPTQFGRSDDLVVELSRSSQKRHRPRSHPLGGARESASRRVNFARGGRGEQGPATPRTP